MNLNLFTLENTLTNQPYEILLFLGIILVVSKLLSLWLSKLKLPTVIAYLITGLLVGLLTFLPDGWFRGSFEYSVDALKFFAKIGVVLIMFSAGLETDISKVKAMGVKSLIITSLGVVVPLCLGTLLAYLYNLTTGGAMSVFSMLYYGVILSATSVSITVAVLKELKKLNSPVGTALVSAAILDDIIGIVLLSVVISMASSNSPDTSITIAGLISQAAGLSGAANVVLIVVSMIVFFVVTFFVGLLLRRFFNFLGHKYPHHIRITILAFGVCFIYSYIAELFSIADITGAFLIGLALSSTNVKPYVDHRSETISNNLFTPVFFSMIMINLYPSFKAFDTSFLVFGLLWVAVGIIGKIIGAGAGGLICKFKFKDSLAIGIGMMARAEVLIVCASKGIDAGLVDNQIMIYTVILILITSFLTPIILKFIYRNEGKTNKQIPPVENKLENEK